MRCLVLSDIHSNLEALEAVLQDAGSVDRIWCLGDVVGYGPDPNRCVELIRSLPGLCIAGNHDWATLGKLDLNDFNPDAREANLWNRQQLEDDNLAWLAERPQTIVEGEFTLTHGSPRHPIWEYIIYAATAEANFGFFDTPYCFVGHTHAPVIFQLSQQEDETVCNPVPAIENKVVDLDEGRFIINPGSVGQPRDGDPRACYILLDTEARTVEYHRVEYPIEKTQAKMMEYNLPLRLVLRLGYGW